MGTEFWIRNPHACIKECAELMVPNIAWDRGTLHKRALDPNKFIELYYPKDVDYRVLTVGEQGAAELRRGFTMKKPYAVYPVWYYSLDSLVVLEEMLAEPVGLQEAVCRSSEGTPDERPILGQEHRVVVTGLPHLHTGPGRHILRRLLDLQEDYPDAIVHLHGLNTFRIAFGLGFRASDIDVRTPASKGSIMLSNGKIIPFEQADKYRQWITQAGMAVNDLDIPRNRCMFNIRSALWAADHWNEQFNFSVKPQFSGSIKTLPKPVKKWSYGPKPVEGDKFNCNTCSLQTKCKYYREGAVCSVPDSETSALAQFFHTRDSSLIIDGLGHLLAIQAKRVETGLNEENIDGLNPEVTKMVRGLFDDGIKLAKLVNPALAASGAARVNVTQIGSVTTDTGGSAGALMAGIVNKFEEQGIPRSQITPEMIKGLLEGPKALDVESEEL